MAPDEIPKMTFEPSELVKKIATLEREHADAVSQLNRIQATLEVNFGPKGMGEDCMRIEVPKSAEKTVHRLMFEVLYEYSQRHKAMLAALRMVMQHGRIDDSESRMEQVAKAISMGEGKSD